MPKPSSVNALVSSYQTEGEGIQNNIDNPDPALAGLGGSITTNIEHSVPFQNDDGTWSVDNVTEYGVFQTLPEIERALNRCDVFIAIGTSGHVYPASGFLHTARLNGAHTIGINLDPPENVYFFDEICIFRVIIVLT